MLERALTLARRLWRWLTKMDCGPGCPHRGPAGEMCEECARLWEIR